MPFRDRQCESLGVAASGWLLRLWSCSARLAQFPLRATSRHPCRARSSKLSTTSTARRRTPSGGRRRVRRSYRASRCRLNDWRRHHYRLMSPPWNKRSRDSVYRGAYGGCAIRIRVCNPNPRGSATLRNGSRRVGSARMAQETEEPTAFATA
jgi:hypothetical protein